jgi:hypothetical protein
MSKSQKKVKKADTTETAISTVNLSFFAGFYPKFYFLETTLKERLYNLFKKNLGESWFTEQLNSGDSLPVIKTEMETILRRKPQDFLLKDYGLLVESGLGMWVEFFNKENYKALKGLPILIFTSLPKDIKRKDLYQKLSEVKAFRNQLFHYRIPAITNTEQLDKILDINDDLVNLLTWLSIPKTSFESDNFKTDLRKIKKNMLR